MVVCPTLAVMYPLGIWRRLILRLVLALGLQCLLLILALGLRWPRLLLLLLLLGGILRSNGVCEDGGEGSEFSDG